MLTRRWFSFMAEKEKTFLHLEQFWYGDEHKLAGFSATLQAIVSFVENSADHIKFVRAGKHQIVFLVKGPIYLVCISSTEESFEGLRGQLELMHGQVLLILTKSVNRCFEKNPKFDMAPLLGGTDVVFRSLIHACSWNPATFLHAYTCLPLAQATRQAASAALQDIADSGVLFALLMCDHKVISLVGLQNATLHPDDILLLANFILSSESFRTSESFSPICLPRYSPMAYLYAYVHFFDENTYLTLLTPRSDAFYDLKDSRARIQDVLLKSNVLLEVQRSLHENVLRVEDVPIDLSSQFTSAPAQSSQGLNSQPLSSDEAIGGPAGLWHFIYKSVYLDQYVSSEFALPIRNPKQQKRLYKAYQKVYASMHDKATGPHRTQFRKDEDYDLSHQDMQQSMPVDHGSPRPSVHTRRKHHCLVIFCLAIPSLLGRCMRFHSLFNTITNVNVPPFLFMIIVQAKLRPFLSLFNIIHDHGRSCRCCDPSGTISYFYVYLVCNLLIPHGIQINTSSVSKCKFF
ncbi:vacuolar fusion protein MON1 homolog [Triticum aestivum]|uniref:vacuolar fusion protein MON1 homolog n=1 Tax=Triticum aestivum TaxID=4565 RepID=UPI001D0070A8|nr:vacuolar fusion protein MON1 homolog [Triticum aestivum]